VLLLRVLLIVEHVSSRSGIVIGILLENGVVDELRMAVVRSLSAGLTLTFHRAFDVTPDPLGALESIVTIGTRHRGRVASHSIVAALK
jgi:copper homeostasis protein CutC